MEDEGSVAEEGISPAQSPLVQLSFQRNEKRKEKYLEAEPKALGITQICLCTYQIISVSVLVAKGINELEYDIFFFIASVLVLIAGCVAVAAQNLHLPTLKACLGMQIVASGASIFNLIFSSDRMNDYYSSSCYSYSYHYDDNFTLHYGATCQQIESTRSHFYAEIILIQVALLAISVTLAAYCCKVVNCCGPGPKMAVLTIEAPIGQE